MTVRIATVSVSAVASYVDLQEFNDGVIVENQGVSTVYIRFSKIFSVVTLQDLQLKAGQSVQMLKKFRFMGFISATGDTSTIQYTAFNNA